MKLNDSGEMVCSSATLQCGKALPFASDAQLDLRETIPRGRGATSFSSYRYSGEPKAYCTAARQSRRTTIIRILLILSLSISAGVFGSMASFTSKGWAMPAQGAKIRAPELNGARGWLNPDKPLTLSALKGKVVLLDFWT